MAGIESIANLSPELQAAFRTASEAERRPVARLEERKANIQNRVELLGDVIGRVDKVKTVLPSLSTPVAIRELQVTSTNERVVIGTADKNIAVPGTHNIEVRQLATPATALSNRFPDKNETRIGTGYFSFETKDGTREVFIDNENATLEGVATTINQANVGMRASIVFDGDDEDYPYRLLLSKDGTGSGNGVEYPEFYFVDPEEELFIDEEKPSLNSVLHYEGFDLEYPSNKIEDLIPGVTLNIKGVSDPGRPENVTIGQDIPQTIVKVKEMVDGVNEVLQFIQDQNNLDENSETRKTLGGDYGIRLAESKIRDALQYNRINIDSDTNPTVRALVDIGISFNKNGTLDFDEKEFGKALDKDFEQVSDLLTGNNRTTGVITLLTRALDAISSPGVGALSNQKKNYQTQLKGINEKVARKMELVERKEKKLKEELVKAQNALNSIQAQSAVLGGQSGGGGIPGLG